MTSYYIRPSVGNDGNAGTYASPWATLAKANGFAFAPGDQLFLESTTYREAFRPTSGGTEADPVLVSPFEYDKPEPVLTGADVVTGWTDQGGNVWAATLAADPNQVFVDDARGNRVGTTGELAAPGDWHWASSVLSVYDTSAPTNVEASVRGYCVWADADGFELQALEIVRSRGEGVVMPSSGRSFWTFDGLQIHDCWSYGIYCDDNSADVLVLGGEFWENLHGLNIDNSARVTVRNAKIHGTHRSNGDGIAVSNSSDIVIENCTIYDYPAVGGSEDGIQLATVTNLRVQGCTISDCRTMVNVSGGSTGTICRNRLGGGRGVDTSALGAILKVAAAGVLLFENNICEGDFGTYAIRLAEIGAGGSIEVRSNRVRSAGICLSVAPTEAGKSRVCEANDYDTTGTNLIFDGFSSITEAGFGAWVAQHPRDLGYWSDLARADR